jgi:hypothetical protein
MSEDQESQSQVRELKVSVSEEFERKMADQYARNIEKYAPMDAYTIKVKNEEIVFNRRKILSKERKELEVLRAQLGWEARRGLKQSVETEDKLYKKTAEYFLIDVTNNTGMTPEQYDSIPFEDIKIILDACTYRTERTIPPLEV